MLKAKTDKKAKVEESLARAAKERKDHESELKMIVKELKEVPYDPKKHEEITEEHDKTDSELNNAYNIRNDLSLAITKLATEARDKQKEIEEAETNSKKVNEMTLDQAQRERFINLVTDYRQHLISQIRPKLAEISGRLLTELTDGKYSGVDLDEEYNMFIYDGNEKHPLPRFSGGEADIANLCLRLAISQLIAESSGIETGFIILDEIFGSQDVHRKASIIEALNGLSKQFRQIILITHVDEIKDTLENIIEVAENEEGVSYIK